MFQEVNNVEASGHGWRNGVYYYAVSARFDGKRETIKLVTDLGEAISLHTRVNAFLTGTYDSEVFNAFNAIKQARVEG